MPIAKPGHLRHYQDSGGKIKNPNVCIECFVARQHSIFKNSVF